MNKQVSDNLSFEEAIAFTQSLLEERETGKLGEEETQEAITSLVKSENGARGFFVTYLTGEYALADNPSTAVINALKSAPEIVSALLVKNLAMSAAMAVTHRRNNNEEMAQASDRVRLRTAEIIKQVKLDLVCQELEQLRESLTTGEGSYEAFLQRWGYDTEQRQVIEQTSLEV
ncbi:MAG: hypothetical protein DSM107014_02610 [Gomphosphaeria aponina SAG 52.96 = DSM 107014]|uniref:Uncharacterized protein n=1 Tax=Gomphosphaeria aponina SAG 52.96 = DSM 107014 TaxID=1521640 RepID=A0A941GTQ2_9CHRO|nr:hypothetical protein [Gomphosphaeria aponina SAG 52.96 = DSM 107014]